MKSIRLLIAGGLVFAALSTGFAESRLVANLQAGKPQVIVVYGTSLTAGGAWVSQLLQALKRDFSNQVALVNSARSGMNSEWGVANLEEKVIRKKPDTVFIEFAINDAVERFSMLIDHEPHWEAIQKSDPAQFKRYMPDGLHPNPEGCREVILPELLKALGLDNPIHHAGEAPKP